MKLKEGFRNYIEQHFPQGLVKLIRLKERVGLVKARMLGWRNSTGEVIIFLDSHMEVNIDWLVLEIFCLTGDRFVYIVHSQRKCFIGGVSQDISNLNYNP